MPGGGVGEALLIGGGASLLGGIGSSLIQNEASKDAARAQTKAVKQGIEAQEQAFGKAEQLQQPFLEQGQGAFNQLSEGILGGQFDRPVEEFQNRDISGQIPGVTTPELRQFSQADILADPGIQFAQEQAQKGVERSAAARGGALGGRALQELQRTATGLAGQQTNQAFNRFSNQQQLGLQAAGQEFGQALSGEQQRFGQALSGEQQRFGQFQDLQQRLSAEDNARFGRLSGLADVGINTARGLGNQAIGQGAQQASSFNQLGNIEAARQIAQGQSFQQPLNTFSQFAQLAPFLMGGGAS